MMLVTLFKFYMFIKCEYMLYVHYYMNVEYYMFDVKNVKICTLVLYKVLL